MSDEKTSAEVARARGEELRARRALVERTANEHASAIFSQLPGASVVVLVAQGGAWHLSWIGSSFPELRGLLALGADSIDRAIYAESQKWSEDPSKKSG